MAALQPGDALVAKALTEDEHDLLLAVEGVPERFLVDKASGAVYVMGAAGAVAAEPRQIGAWRAADSSIVIVSPTAHWEEDENNVTEDEDEDEEEEEDGDESPPPLPAARVSTHTSGAAAGSPPALQTALQASLIVKPTARPAPSRPWGPDARPVQQPAPPPLPTADQVAEMKLHAAELGLGGAELEAATAAHRQLHSAAENDMISKENARILALPREVVFSAGPLGVSLVQNPAYAGDGSGPRTGEQYSTRVEKLNLNQDGTLGQARRSGKVQPDDLLVSVERDDLKGLQYSEVVAQIKRAPRPVLIGFSDVKSLTRMQDVNDLDPMDAAGVASLDPPELTPEPSGLPMELKDEEMAEANALVEEKRQAQDWSTRMEAKRAASEPDPVVQPEVFWTARMEAAQRAADLAHNTVQISSAVRLEQPPALNAAAPATTLGLEDSMTNIDRIKAEIRAAERLKEDMRRQDNHGRKAKLAVAAVERAVFAGGGEVADSGEDLTAIFATGGNLDAVQLDQRAKIDDLPSP
eukprot:COSAG02_NODE_10185_length_1999_cov_1.533684_2_plen_524_part_01